MRLLLLVLLLIATPAQATWREARSTHFVIYSEDEPDKLRDFATRLERFDAALRVLLKLPERADGPHNRLTVFALPNVAQVATFHGGGKDVAGFYLGRAGHSVAVVPRSGSVGLSVETVLLHEYTHHFLFRNMKGAYPVWFVEGFAEFNSTARFGEDGSIDFGLPAQHRAAEIFHLNKLPIEKLLDADPTKLRGNQIYAMYGRGWLLTHYLRFAPARAGQLDTYLAELSRGRPNLEAARTAFGDLFTLGQELERYKHKKGMTYLRMDAANLKISPIEVRDLSAGAAAIMPLHLRSKLGVDEAGAKALVEAARKITVSHSDDPFVQLALAEAELDAGQFDAADRLLDRLLAADAQNVQALVFRGLSAALRLKEAKSTDAEAWKAARRWLIRANRAEPTAPEPLLRFYQTFELAGEKPNANAIASLLGALELAPEDDGLRLAAGYQLLEDGRSDEARAVFAPLAASAHGEGSAFVRRVLDSLAQGGAPAALALWKSEEAKPEAATVERKKR